MKKDTTVQQNDPKTMFFLNMIANINANYPAVESAHLDKNILKVGACLADSKVQEVVGKWNLVWGPAVHNSKYTRKSFWTRYATDNAMYVAQKEGTQEYFIGVSGTNGISYKGWFDQDFPVEKTVSWPPEFLGIKASNDTSGAKISMAAYTGLKALWSLKPSTGAKEKGTTLIDFLKRELTKPDSSVSIGGHSLGACLTPLVATAIADIMKNSDNTEKGEKRYPNLKINAYPTAGPTPGNQAFANHLQEIIHEYHATFNTNDIVPLSWDFNGLDALRSTYANWTFGDKKIKTDEPLTDRFLHWASHVGKKNHYTRMPKTVDKHFKLTTWQQDLISSDLDIDKVLKEMVSAILKYAPKLVNQFERIYKDTSDESISELFRFLIQVLLQHVPAYSNPTTKEGSIPWEISEKDRMAFKAYFIDPKNYPDQSESKQKESKTWAIFTGLATITELTKIAADWLEEHDTTQVSPAAITIDQKEIEVLEEQMLQTLEKLFVEEPEIAKNLPFGANPYLQMFS